MSLYLRLVYSRKKEAGRERYLFKDNRIMSFMRKRGIFAAAFIFFICFLAIASASFTLIGKDIQSSYIGGDNIAGTLNITFRNEPASASLTSNFNNGNETLLDFLQKNSLIEGEDYNCSVHDCNSAYAEASSGINGLSLSSNDIQSIGFKLTGSDVQVTNVQLTLSSDAGPSCSNELQADVLGNNSILIQSNSYTNDTCGGISNGCYDSSASGQEWIKLGQDTFCERMTLAAAPAFQVGAQIKQNSGASGKISMELFDSDWQSKGSCDLPVLTQQIQNVNCIIPTQSPSQQNYYLCISSDGNSGFYIDSESTGPLCGNSGTNFDSYVIDYNLFAQALKFDTPVVTVNETTYQQLTGDSLVGLVDSYINDKYNRDCSGSDGCIIPLDLFSVDSQNVNIANAIVEYRKQGTGSSTTQQTAVSTLDKTDAIINSGPLALDLSKSGLTIPITTNVKTLQLYLDGTRIFTTNIDVTNGFNFTLIPKTALVGVDTQFYLSTSTNITSVVWKFGDGSPDQTSNGNSIYHRYLQEGQYDLEADAANSAGITVSRHAIISVGNAQNAAQMLLQQSKNNIGNLSISMNGYDSWIKNALNDKINLTYSISYLDTLQSDYNNGSNYSNIVSSLVNLQIPSNILADNIGTLPLDVGYNDVDAAYAIALMGNSSSGINQDQLKQNIITWDINNYNTNVDYKVLSEQNDMEVTPVFTYFKVTLTPKNADTGNVNLIINYPKDSIVFKSNYNAATLNSDSSSATSIPVSGTQTIEFLLPGEVQVSELGAYIVPGIDKLNLVNGKPVENAQQNPRPGISVWLYVILVVIVLIAYIALYEWYKKRYESYLFKNRDDLYNLINFIYNARVSGAGDEDTRKKLSSYNWKSEQITYALKKLDGKRTGMWEIPIFKFLENKKVKEEIEKRQQTNIGKERFIKSQY